MPLCLTFTPVEGQFETPENYLQSLREIDREEFNQVAGPFSRSAVAPGALPGLVQLLSDFEAEACGIRGSRQHVT